MFTIYGKKNVFFSRIKLYGCFIHFGQCHTARKNLTVKIDRAYTIREILSIRGINPGRRLGPLYSKEESIMKKVLLVVAVLLLSSVVAFAAPLQGDALALKADITGSAKLIWGMGFDDASQVESGIQYASGFKNEANVGLKLTLIGKRTHTEKGEGAVYAEIAIKDIELVSASGYDMNAPMNLVTNLSAKLFVGPVVINILGETNSTDMAQFGQKLVSGREDKFGAHLELTPSAQDAKAENKGEYRGLSIALADPKITDFVKFTVGIQSMSDWENNDNFKTYLIKNISSSTPTILVQQNNNNIANAHKVPAGKVYINVTAVDEKNDGTAEGTSLSKFFTFDMKPWGGANEPALYYVMDAELLNGDIKDTKNANYANVYNIYVAVGLGSKVVPGLTFDVKASMASYLGATTNGSFTPAQSGLGVATGYTMNIAKGYDLKVGFGLDWKTTSYSNPGNKDEIQLGSGVAFTFPGAVINNAEVFGLDWTRKFQQKPGVAFGIATYTSKANQGNKDGKDAAGNLIEWSPALWNIGASFYDADLLPIVDLFLYWTSTWNSGNNGDKDPNAGDMEFGAKVSAKADIFQPFVEFWTVDVGDKTDQGVGNEKDYYTGLARGDATFLKVGLDLSPIKYTTFGIVYESGNLQSSHETYVAPANNAAQTPRFWGTLQASVKLSF